MNDVVVVGAGPAGLATARELRVQGIGARVLERGPHLAHAWRNLYDSLTLHTGKHLSALPGMPFPRSVPLFPRRDDFVSYLEAYAARFEIDVEPHAPAERLEAPEGTESRWRIHTPTAVIRARAVVVATGIMANPLLPEVPGRERFSGEVLHSIEYRTPERFIGRRVLVVGVGNSGGEIGSELAAAGARVSIAVRSGANVVPLTILGVPIQYVAYGMRRLPRRSREAIAASVLRLTDLRRGPPVLPRPPHSALDAIPIIGFHLVDAIRSGRITVRPGIAGYTERGVRFIDGEEAPFDAIILATGFRAALQPLGGLVGTDARGFAIRSDRVTSAEHERLFFVGHNYDATGGLMNIALDSRLVAERIRSLVR
jgi:cation diffusion facilitator CzcD-associated flavoprotein CzcO